MPPEDFFKYSGTNSDHFTWKEAPSDSLSQNAEKIEGEAREKLLKSLKQLSTTTERNKLKENSIPRQSTPVPKNESNGKIKKKKRVKTTLVKELFIHYHTCSILTTRQRQMMNRM